MSPVIERRRRERSLTFLGMVSEIVHVSVVVAAAAMLCFAIASLFAMLLE